MRVSGRWKHPRCAALLIAALAGCQLPPHPPTAPATAPPQPPAHFGTPYDVVPEASLLLILVYRAGALASAGHNHVIASHDLTGTLYVPPELTRGSFELHVPVATLTVDEAALRAQQPGSDFPPDVSEGAKEGTRRNMLGTALLDAAQYPDMVLSGVGIGPAAPVVAAAAARAVTVGIESTVRGAQRTFTVPVCYRLVDDALIAEGDFPLRQTALGLTPFSAMLGALQVQDEMRVRFRILARRGRKSGEASAGEASAGAAPLGALPRDSPCAATAP